MTYVPSRPCEPETSWKISFESVEKFRLLFLWDSAQLTVIALELLVMLWNVLPILALSTPATVTTASTKLQRGMLVKISPQ